MTLEHHLLAANGIDNLRQLGGYETTDGKRVKQNLLFRSGDLSKAQPEALHLLEELGLKTIFDLRGMEEIATAQDRLPPGAQYIHSPGIVTVDSALQSLLGAGQSKTLDMPALIRQTDFSQEQLTLISGHLLRTYIGMARQPEAFATVFAVLLQKPGQPLLFHCTAGKDRTGLCAAFILLALGVPMETVEQDYLFSNTARRAAQERELQALRQYIQHPGLLAAIENALTVQPAYLQAALDVICDTCGDFETYRREKLLLTNEMQAALRDAYLE